LNLLETLLDFVDHRPADLLTFKSQNDDGDGEDDENESPDYVTIRKNVSRIVTLVTMNGICLQSIQPKEHDTKQTHIQIDANMYDIPKAYPSVISRFQQWMTLGLDPQNDSASSSNLSLHLRNAIEEDEIRMSGALCMGNLARSDETCHLLLTKYGVGEALLELLELELERLKKSGRSAGSGNGDEGGSGANGPANGKEMKSCVKVLHAAVGAFKNFSLASKFFSIVLC
jgi:hypothetical protein